MLNVKCKMLNVIIALALIFAMCLSAEAQQRFTNRTTKSMNDTIVYAPQAGWNGYKIVSDYEMKGSVQVLGYMNGIQSMEKEYDISNEKINISFTTLAEDKLKIILSRENNDSMNFTLGNYLYSTEEKVQDQPAVMYVEKIIDLRTGKQIGTDYWETNSFIIPDNYILDDIFTATNEDLNFGVTMSEPFAWAQTKPNSDNTDMIPYKSNQEFCSQNEYSPTLCFETVEDNGNLRWNGVGIADSTTCPDENFKSVFKSDGFFNMRRICNYFWNTFISGGLTKTDSKLYIIFKLRRWI